MWKEKLKFINWEAFLKYTNLEQKNREMRKNFPRYQPLTGNIYQLESSSYKLGKKEV